MVRLTPMAAPLALAALAVATLAACASARRLDADTPAVRGRVVAGRNCAGCHNVNAKGASFLGEAPPFRMLPPNPKDIAQFAADIRLHHPNGMPAIMLTPAQARDLAAYIQTLQSDDPKTRLPDVPPCFARSC